MSWNCSPNLLYSMCQCIFLAFLKGHTGWVNDTQFSKDQKWVLSCSQVCVPRMDSIYFDYTLYFRLVYLLKINFPLGQNNASVEYRKSAWVTSGLGTQEEYGVKNNWGKRTLALSLWLSTVYVQDFVLLNHSF